MNRLALLLTLAGLSACAPAATGGQAAPPAPAAAEARPVPEAVHWARSATEHRAIFLQTYRAAGDALREAAAGRAEGTWAVVMDADETVLDNSLFQLRLTRSGQTYDEEIWNDWVREEAAPPLPGALEFISLVRRLGGRVAIVTNREAVVCPETRRNLAAVGAAADVVLCRGDTSDKNPRFEQVRRGLETGLPPLDVVMYVGDNIRDFPDGSQEMRRGSASELAEVGRTWFVLPNPMYGSWESVPVREAEGFELGEPMQTAALAGAPAFSDIHSFARPDKARVTHVHLDLAADFATRRLSGTATLDLEVAPGADEIVLDTRDLEIRTVTDASGRSLQWTLGDSDPVVGTPLTVGLPPGTDRIVIGYATSPEAGALQWLTPQQTAGGMHPYLFSQGQAILTRTWIPTQDSPGIRQTYTARITVPAELKAVMSAEMLTPQGEPEDGARAFEFRLDQPVPPYLIALAVGDIAFRPLGPRSGVYAEPSVVDAAAHEFADVERMIATAEALYGPYRWGRYDILVLPPSFPFGGMENPRLTFATPTILAGDRSLVSLIAHELAHSWSGNLVTNADWSGFWLNEGFTSYFENRIMEALYGPERAAMLAVLGWQGLLSEVEALDPADTRLHLDLAGRDPDAGMTAIAYDKGAAFLRTIEEIVGRQRFDQYLRSYFDRHAFQPMTTERFLEDIRTHLVQGDESLESRLLLDEWAYGIGIPENAVGPRSDAFSRVEAVAAAFASGSPAAGLPTSGWSTQEWQHFLASLPRDLTRGQLEELDRTFGLSRQGNSEVLFGWLMIAVRNRYEPAVPALEEFLTSQGRRKFLTPLYQGLMDEGEWGQALARRIYERARPLYHPVSAGSVDEIVGHPGR